MTIFSFVYAIVGTLSLVGMIKGALPGHESQEMMVVILAYAVAVCGIICGIVCMKGMAGMAKVFGALFTVCGLASLVYVQITQGSFSTFDCLAACYGIAIFKIASDVEKAE